MTLPDFKASAAAGALEFRLQIVVEVDAASDPGSSREGRAYIGDAPPDAARLPRLLGAARTFLRDVSQGLDVQMATLTWPSGVRVIAQGAASPEDLAGIREAAVDLGRECLSRPRSAPSQ
jgi:hypothetical protein